MGIIILSSQGVVRHAWQTSGEHSAPCRQVEQPEEHRAAGVGIVVVVEWVLAEATLLFR